MTALLILGVVTGALFLACRWADRTPPAEPEQHPQPSHVRLTHKPKVPR